MNELKAITAYEANWKATSNGDNSILVYLKSEADKVIAELKQACNSKDDWCVHTLKENRHHKYKRCLAMAEWCNANCMHTVLLIGHKIMPHWEWRIKTNYWYKWRKIWLALAEEPTWTKFLQLIHKEATNAVDKSNA